jgi:hypothetical protein
MKPNWTKLVKHTTTTYVATSTQSKLKSLSECQYWNGVESSRGDGGAGDVVMNMTSFGE